MDGTSVHVKSETFHQGMISLGGRLAEVREGKT